MLNRRWIMNILDVCWLSETKTIELFSDFLAFTLSSKNSHQLGLNQPTDMFHHSTESWEHGEDDRTWAGALRTLCWPPKQRNILLPNSLATVVFGIGFPNFWGLILLKLSFLMRAIGLKPSRVKNGYFWFFQLLNDCLDQKVLEVRPPKVGVSNARSKKV